MADLLATPGVREVVHLRGTAGVLALHGGLEQHTAEMARAVAALARASRYTVVLPAGLYWHVPSVCFDPGQSAALARFLGHVDTVLSVHGFGRKGFAGTVLLGGSNRSLARELGGALRRRTALRVVDDLEAIPRPLRGVHRRNPVNLPHRGGVQVELSPGARQRPVREAVVTALADVLAAHQPGLAAGTG